MAGELYPKDGPRQRTSAAEVAFYGALSRALPGGWTAWHSLRLRTERGWEGEGDFVVADPRRGFVCVEVKGGSLELRGGRWHQNGRALERAPRDQAQGFVRALGGTLSRKGHLGVPFGVACAFPDVDFSDGPDTGDLSGLVLGRRDLPWLGEHLVALFDRVLAGFPPPRDGRWVAALHALWGETWVPRVRLVDRLSDVDRERVALDEKQLELLAYAGENRRARVEGSAGTGKTIVARELGLRRAREGERVVYFCFTEALAHAVDRAFEEALGPARTVHAHPIRQYARALVRAQGAAPAGGEAVELAGHAFWEQISLRAACDALPPPAERPDLVIVDEAQDLAENDWMLVQALAQGRGLWLFGDDGQRFWSDRAVPPEVLEGMTLLRLLRQQRNPPPIAALAARYLVDPLTATAAAESSPPWPAPDPSIVRVVPAPGDGLDRVRHELDTLRKEGVRPSEIVILSLQGVGRSQIVKRDALGSHTLCRADAPDAGEHVVADTFLRFKGLERPLHAWLATRLARLFPVVLALYEQVKPRHQAVDQLDLLLKLRDLLAQNKVVRGHLQSLFDHLFVDEFQDTDPLQAEIVLYLCEQAPRAKDWRKVQLTAGKLTLVGDPKQSIYRFRRADVAMYDQVRALVASQPHVAVHLSANFRSTPELIAWLNHRMDEVLGPSPDGETLFDVAEGVVYHQPLAPGRAASTTAGPAVHAFPFHIEDGKADEYRALEAHTLARYLRWLVEKSGLQVTDPVTSQPRPVAWGDVAVLGTVTTKLPLLFEELDALGVPYAARGGTLFLTDDLHRQFLLGLRALADRDDGIAEAALLRPPFFALDLADLVEARARGEEGAETEATTRVEEARAIIKALRKARFTRSPGSTARDLLERTALARTVALGPNGAQRLAHLRELCLALEHRAATERLDYDAITAQLRTWVDAPAQLDPPHPVGSEAVQVLTVHQAKGLEFPVVVLWDGRGQWTDREQNDTWKVSRTTPGWILNLDGLHWEHPQGLGLAATEKQYREAERKRVVYVAATRARDLLVLPMAGPSEDKYICGKLLAAELPGLVEVLDETGWEKSAKWAKGIKPPAPPSLAADGKLGPKVEAAWGPAREEAARARFAPVGITTLAHANDLRGEGEDAPPRKRREGRFGPVFGHAVHLAIGHALRDPKADVDRAVERAAAEAGLDEHLAEARADVTRTLGTLSSLGLREPGVRLLLEYPVAAPSPHEGQLLVGYIDLLAQTATGTWLIDFKTDAPASGDVAKTYPAYLDQLRRYGELLRPSALGLRTALLFTADGALREPPGKQQERA